MSVSVCCKVLISFLIGCFLCSVQRLPEKTRVVRVMPNTASLVREGVSVFSIGMATLPSDGSVVEELMKSLGYCRQVKESLIEPVSGVSGSGIAYVSTSCRLLMYSMGSEGVQF